MTSEDTIAKTASKIPIRNVWYLLLYAWDMAHWKGRFNAGSEDAPSLLGLLTKILAESTEHLVRQQLRRSHEPHHEIIRGIRGRIDFATCIKKRTFERGTASCSFSELSVDTLKNRILLATLHRLSRDSRLAFRDNAEQSNELRQRLHVLIREMQGVKLTQIGVSDFSRLQLTRNDQDYFLPISICAMIHRLEMPTESTGDHALIALLRNEVVFHKLFERFVRNFCRYYLHGYEVKAENLEWPTEAKCNFMPIMQTDVSLTRKSDNQRMVIDTKYYVSLFAANRHDSDKFRSGHIYQIYAYLRSQEEKGDGFRNASGMLLYPTVEQDIFETVKMQGHSISIATVNLNQPWETIEDRLLSFVN